MRLIRFMSVTELLKYMAGETLENGTRWSLHGSKSDSIGFCFFPGQDRPEDILHYAAGVVCSEICAEFETRIPEFRFRKARARYADPDDLDYNWGDILRGRPPKRMVMRDEYSITEYSKKTLKLIRYGHPVVTDSGYKIIWQAPERTRRIESCIE